MGISSIPWDPGVCLDLKGEIERRINSKRPIKNGKMEKYMVNRGIPLECCSAGGSDRSVAAAADSGK